MKNREVPRLSEQQERDIVDSLINFVRTGEAVLHNGSSRVVFCDVDANTYDLLSDFVPTGVSVVIKVNMGRAGVIQSQQERDVYESANETQVEYLAPIYCYGNCIQVMEAVLLDENRSVADEVYYCLDYYDGCSDIDFAIEVARAYYCVGRNKELNEEQTAFVNDWFDDIVEMRNCIGLISQLIGWTGDLTQVGKDHRGNIVLYDYGYFSNSDDNCVNDTDDVWRFTQEDWLETYLDDLVYNYTVLDLDDMRDIEETIEDCYQAQ